jgi:hypothetical protein
MDFMSISLCSFVDYENPKPFSFRDTHRDNPMTKWSRTDTSKSLPAWTMARVTLTSSGLGVGSVLGWLCAIKIAAAFRCSAGLNNSPTRTIEELSDP